MNTLLRYITGCVAIILMLAAVIVTVDFITTDPDAGAKLASAVLGGIGSVFGAAIGGALVLRFRASRRFIRKLINEKDDD